jgi:LysM repeat protein
MLPALPKGWFKWTLWQYSDKGVVNGINASVDMNLFNGTLEELYAFAGAQPVEDKPKTHKITTGDTFEKIASKYGVTVRELVMANLQLLKVGETLAVPSPVAIPIESGTNQEGEKEETPAKTYTIQSGDTLSFIAVKFAVTVAAIASLNNIKNINNIKVGTVLKIP